MENILKINEKVLEVIENAEIKVCGTSNQGNGYFVTELEFYSNLGEDVIVTICHNNTTDDFVSNLESYYNDFDPEEHAVMWYKVKDKVTGVPQSLRALLEDAEGIEETLEELAIECRKAMRRQE